MQIEALQLLKEQLIDHFIDKYEDFQSLFDTSGQFQDQTGFGAQSFGTLKDDSYLLFPESKVRPIVGKKARLSVPVNTFSSAIALTNYKGKDDELADKKRLNLKPSNTLAIPIIDDQPPEVKHLSNNQEYQLLIKYQRMIGTVLEASLDHFKQLMSDPKFIAKHKDLFNVKAGPNIDSVGGTGHGASSALGEQAVKEIALLKKQLADLQMKNQKQEDLIHSLRKQYLKEIINLREASTQGGEKFKDSLSVSFFDVTDGIDASVVEILNLRLQDMARQFNVQIEEKAAHVRFLNETIQKYKRLAPKTFKLMELPLQDIFYSLYIVESDAAKVWAALMKSYPPGHFDGLLEDIYGGNMTKEQEKKLEELVQETHDKAMNTVKMSTERLCLQIREKDHIIHTKNQEINALKDQQAHDIQNLTEDLRMQFELKLRDLEKLVNSHYAKEIQGYKDREEAFKKEKQRLKQEIEDLMKQKFILRMQGLGSIILQYRKQEEEGNTPFEAGSPEEKKLAEKKRERKAFRMEREDVANQFYERVRQLILGSDLQRMQAKLDLRKEMMKDYKEKYEKTTQQLYELKVQINESIDDYEFVKQQLHDSQSSYAQLQTYNSTLLNDLHKIQYENECLREANKATLEQVIVVEQQKALLEEKYNASLEKVGDELVLKKKYKSPTEEGKRTLQDKILERLSTEAHGAFNCIEMAVHSKELAETKHQSYKVDADAQTMLKNINLKITQESATLTKRQKQTLEGGVDEFCQTKIKAEQFDFYVRQQQSEKERLERRLSKLKEKADEEIDLAEMLLRDSGQDTSQMNVGSLSVCDQGINSQTPKGPPGPIQESGTGAPMTEAMAFAAQKKAEEETKQLQEVQKHFMLGVQEELAEKTEALQHLLGEQRVQVKQRSPRRRKRVEEQEGGGDSKSEGEPLASGEDNEEDEKEEGEEGDDQKKQKKKAAGKQGLKGMAKSKGMKSNISGGVGSSGADSSRILNIQKGQLKKFSDGSNFMEPKDGFDASVFSAEVLRDPRYFQQTSNEFQIKEASAAEFEELIKFPRFKDFNFDMERYKMALAYMKSKFGLDFRKRMSQSQMQRLYPQNQPGVFKRLIENSANAIKKFEKKLKEIQGMSNKEWMNKLTSQNFISEEQLMVLGGADKITKANEQPSSQRILKVMDKMLKIGKEETQSPNLDKQIGFFKVKGVNSNSIFTTDRKSTAVFKTRKESVKQQLTATSSNDAGTQSIGHNRRQSEGGLILLKDDNDVQTLKERKRKIKDLLSHTQSRGTDSSNRRQIKHILNTTAADTPGIAALADSINKQSSLTLDSSRVHQLLQRLHDSENSAPLQGCITSNVSLEATPKSLRGNLMSSHVTKRAKKSHQRNQDKLLRGFVENAFSSPAKTDAKQQNQDLQLTPFANGQNTASCQVQDFNTAATVDREMEPESLIYKRNQLRTPPSNEYYQKKKEQKQTKPGIEIFSQEQSLERRMLFQVPRSVHSLINDIAHKNHQELHNNAQMIQQQQAVLMSKRHRGVHIYK